MLNVNKLLTAIEYLATINAYEIGSRGERCLWWGIYFLPSFRLGYIVFAAMWPGPAYELSLNRICVNSRTWKIIKMD